MKKTNKLVTAAFGALLAAQAPQALGQEARQLAEPFRTDVTSVLNGEQGQLTRVDSPDQLAESYIPGSSVVVEGDFALTDRVLQNLQSEINEKYSHLNILVYLAEDGKSFERYNGQTLNSSDLCGTNPGLAYLRDSFYEGADQAGEGNHIIFYLAAKRPGYDYNMVCTLISPQMADLIGSDQEIFVKGRPIFDDVFSELKQDFNRLGAINAFLRGIDERVQQAQREQERAMASHIARVNSLRTQLLGYTTGIDGLLGESVNLEGSKVYTEFAQRFSELDVLIQGEAEYISVATLSNAERDMRSLDSSYDSVFAAITGFSTAAERVAELEQYTVEFQSSEYYEALNSQNAELVLALTKAGELINAGNLDYYSAMLEVEEKFNAIGSGINKIKFADAVKKGSLGLAAAGILGTLGRLNRRKKRLDSKKEFLAEFEKLAAGLKEIQRVFDEEIEGNTESIEIFFGDQKGVTGERIKELKVSVAYISVLLPKIGDILRSVASSLSFTSLSKFRILPYENAINMLNTHKHIIDPSKSDADRKLLSKISGEEVQSFSELIDEMTQTLPELIKRLDENITTTKNIFTDLDAASENSDKALDENTNLTETFSNEGEKLVALLGSNFFELAVWVIKTKESIQNRVSDNLGEDLLGEYREVTSLNTYIKFCIETINALSIRIKTEQPSQYRGILEEAGYDTTEFLEDIQARFTRLFTAFEAGVTSPESTDSLRDANNAVEGFYNEMKTLTGLNSSRLLQDERREGLSAQLTNATSNITQYFGDRLGVKKLFLEEGNDIHDLLVSTANILGELKVQIQQREKEEGRLSLNTLDTDITKGHDIVQRTNIVAKSYDTSREQLSQIEKDLQGKLGVMKTQITGLKDNFHIDVMTLRDDDYSAEGSDKDISNNAQEIQAFFQQIAGKFVRVDVLLKEGKFLELQDILESIYAILENINEHILEVEHVHKNVEKVHGENPGNFKKLEARLDIVNKKSLTAHLTPKLQKKIKDAGLSRQSISHEMEKKKPDPYYIEDSILEFDDIISLLEGEVERDEAEYREYIEHTKSASKVLEKLRKQIGEADSDNEPDSKKAKRVIGSIDDINAAYQRLASNLGVQNANWYELTDDLEDFTELCEAKMNILFQDEKSREQAYKEIKDAASKIKTAKNWSGRHVSISSQVGQDYLRFSHKAFNEGRFSDAVSNAGKAEQKARNEISSAEDRDRSEIRRRKRKKDAAAAARRRRNASSSSSSSSFGGGGGGGGFSGFSGGGGF